MRVILLILIFHYWPALSQSPSGWESALTAANQLRAANSAGAEPAFRRAEALAGQIPDGGLSLAHVWNDFATLLMSRDRYVEGESMLREALAIYRQNPAVPALSIGSVEFNLAVIARKLDRRQESEALHHQAIATIRHAGGDNQQALATAHCGLGQLLLEMSRTAEAELELTAGLQAGEAALGVNHPVLVPCLATMAETQLQRGAIDTARRTFSRALQIVTTVYGPNSIQAVEPLKGLARAELESGRVTAAKQYWRRSLIILESSADEKSQDYLSLLVQMSQIERLAGNDQEAQRLLRRAIDGATASDAKVILAQGLHQLARLHAAERRHALAEPLYRRSAALSLQTLGEQSTQFRLAIAGLAETLFALGRTAESEASYRQAIALADKAKEWNNISSLDLLQQHARVLRKLKRKKEAEDVEGRRRILLTAAKRQNNQTIDILELKRGH